MATIRQGARKDTDNKVLKEKLSLSWTGPFKILAVGPSPATETPDHRPLGLKLLYLDLPSHLSGPAAKPRVTVARCKPCVNPYDVDDIPKYLPVGLTQYVLYAFAHKSPPDHVTTDDVTTHPSLSMLPQSPAINVYTAVAAPSPSYTRLTGLTCSAPRGNAN